MVKSLKEADSTYSANAEKETKKVNVYLAGAIIVLPQIFSWFLLRKGYANKARLLSFAWMVIWLAFYNAYQSITPEERAAIRTEQEARKIAEKNADNLADSNDKLKVRIMSSWKNAVKEVLIDPDSAKFKDVVYIMNDSRTPFACGQVNSKNSFNGYTGFKKFITVGLREYTFVEGETKDFHKLWNNYCVNGQRL